MKCFEHHTMGDSPERRIGTVAPQASPTGSVVPRSERKRAKIPREPHFLAVPGLSTEHEDSNIRGITDEGGLDSIGIREMVAWTL